MSEGEFLVALQGKCVRETEAKQAVQKPYIYLIHLIGV